jgi:N-acyl-D-amino-acid deacylase
LKDYLIKGALTADGSGAPARKCDMLLGGGLIKAVSASLPPQGKDCETIDASGLAALPGFIDPHSHSEMSVLAAPDSAGKLSQGVTTEINGNCGLSVFPVTDKNRAHLEELYSVYNTKITWDSIGDYAEIVKKTRPALNCASLCGHNTLRAAVRGYGEGAVSPGDMEKAAELLDASLAGGAAGFSCGLIYIPGKFSTEEEISAFIRVLAKYDRPHTTHLRSEGNTLIEALEEAVRVCRAGGGRKLHVSHLKTSGKSNHHKLDAVLAIIERERANGLELTADRYPYTESMTTLSVVTPAPYDNMSDPDLKKFLAEPGNFNAFLAKLREKPDDYWDSVRIVDSGSPLAEGSRGVTLSEISRRRGVPAPELCALFLREDPVGTTAAFSGMSYDNMIRILSRPYVCCCTDETSRPIDYSLGRSHPRGFGSFPRFLKMMSEKIGFERAAAKMTALPAAVFGLKDRGRIEPGLAADLVLLDMEKLHGAENFANPHEPAKGVELVFVNGAPAYRAGEISRPGHGRFLRPSDI